MFKMIYNKTKNIQFEKGLKLINNHENKKIYWKIINSNTARNP